MRAGVAGAFGVALGALASGVATAAPAEDAQLEGSTVIFARGAALIKGDARGKTEVELAPLPAGVAVRALRTDALGKVLIADLDGKWSWMPLDGAASALIELPCADGPAQLAVDGRCVLCRSLANPATSIIVNLASGRHAPIDVPTPGTRLVGSNKGRRLVWADAGGVWSSPPGNPKNKTRVAPEAPLRGFLPSPDGTRAVGVYTDLVHVRRKETKPADMLMGFALDGRGARRKSIRDSVPVEWSHDGKWVLVQDGSAACIVGATGGQYKCWKGYTAASIAADGSYALLLGNRDGSKRQKKSKKDAKEQEPDEGEPEDAGDAHAIDDVAVAPPAGPLALFRATLDGAHTASPARIYREVDGAAVWVSPRP